MHLIKPPMEVLAEKLDVPSDALVETMNQYNMDAANGSDSYNRTINSSISVEGPYYALQMYIRYYASLGGLHINDQMQVLTKDQTPIEGLYAAGELLLVLKVMFIWGLHCLVGL